MRHGSQQGRRPRNKGHQGGGNGGFNNGTRRSGQGGYNRNQIFDSNGPEVRIRGTAHQVCEKYLALAKDAASVGDRILAESYLQHAEHYQRMITVWNEETRETQKAQDAYVPNGNSNQNNDDEQEDDLSLPISILGGDVKAESDELSSTKTSMLESA